MFLLPHDHNPHPIQRNPGGKRRHQSRLRLDRLLLPLLHLLRYRVAGRPLALPHRNQLARLPYKGRRARDRHELGLQLHGGRNHTHRHPIPAVEILHHLDHFQRLVRAHCLSLLPGNGRPHARGH